ncbi:MAG: hypothetical protein R3C58_14655 [Parvularculaceae bacterium]
MKDIAFIDLEASGLSPRSWPIEVGWCLVGGAPEAILVKPVPDWSLSEWSKEAEALHGVSCDTLVKKGAEPKLVCERLNAALAGRAVYSDAPDWDGFWLYRLFQAAGVKQRFTLSHLGELFRSVPPEKMDAYVSAAEKKTPRKHRAIPDVLHMRTLYELAAGAG